jgi:hypothetical protein
MKKVILPSMFCAVMVFSLQAQKVSSYTYLLDNGINVKSEQCWNQVWVDQRYDAVKASDQTPPLSLSVRTLGDLTSGSAFKLYGSGKEVKVQGAKAGTYNMKVTSKLSGKPGTLSFDLDNIIIKPQTKTTVSVTLYDYQILIDETAGSQKGLSSFNSKVDRYKGNAEQNPSCGTPTFYLKGKHDKPVTPDATISNKNGRIIPGTYDVLISLGAPGKIQKVWLENFTMKPDVSYNITTNLNAGVIEYAGGNRDVKAFHMYPAGTADKQKGTPAPDKNLELIKCESQSVTSACPPGTYDVLLNIGNGARYEWRKNIIVKTGSRVQVK